MRDFALEAWAVYYRELLLLRRRTGRLLAAMAVSPILYLVVFGHGMGRTVQVNGVSYAAFLLPGLAAMSSMMQAYALSGEINIARLYYRIFEEFQASPIRAEAYVLGEVCAGTTRGVAGAVVITAVGAVFGRLGHIGPWYWLAVGLNAFFFAGLAVCVAMLVRTHQDQSLFTNFIVTPMAFLGGTFFPAESLPDWARTLVNLIPLTHASQAIRQASLGQPTPWGHLAVLVAMGVCAFVLATALMRRAQD